MKKVKRPKLGVDTVNNKIVWIICKTFSIMQMQEEDQQLWQRIQNGEKEAFSMLFLRYHPLLLHYGIRLCHDEDLAEECIQDLFCYLYEKRKNLVRINHLKGYLFASFRYRIMRKRQRENQAFSIDSFPENSWGFQAPVEDLLIQRELDSFRQQQLLSFLEELSQRQREVIFLKYYNGLDAAEITQVMGISHQGVLNMLYKALKNLRRLARSSNVADHS